MKRSSLCRKTPLRPKRDSKRVTHPERVQHKRMKRKATDKDADEQRHLDRIGRMPCLVTKRSPVVIHHLMKAPGKRCRRDHRFVVPLIPGMHNMGPKSVHSLGSEARFEREHGFRPGYLVDWAIKEWEKTSAQ